MQDDYPKISVPRRRGGGQFLAVLLAFVLGAGTAAALFWHGDLDKYLPRRTMAANSAMSVPTGQPQAADITTVSSVEARLAMLEDRFSRLGFQADAAAGNAARAEGLLIAFAARRMIDKGEPLGFVGDQLRLRFADAQPSAVDTIVAFAAAPVTIDQLSARLEALAPDLTDDSSGTSLWERTRREVTGLFIVRRDSSTLLTPDARIGRARLMLAAGRIPEAIEEVERLPGADFADKFIADAQRYDDVQRALDLIETTAMLEPHRLKDGAGQTITDPSPLAAPTPQPRETPVADGSDAAAT